MGLLVGSDGSYRSWLAALFCCCAADNNDEKDFVKDTYQAEAVRTGICAQQPAPLTALPSMPATQAIHVPYEAGFRYNDRALPVSDRPPSLKPLDFGETSLLGRTYLPLGQRTPKNNVKRTNIGQPTAFRRLELTEDQRRSLIPLQLEPVALRDSVVMSGPENGFDSQYTVRDSIPGCTLTHAPTRLVGDSHRMSQYTKERQPRRPALSSYSSSSSMRSIRRQALESHSSSSSSSPHQSIDWGRFNRKRNSLRKPSSESMDSEVEQEIIELNTIVEEKRSESSRSRGSDGHISAVAPLMSIRARSETLNDIGSAFSRSRPVRVDGDSGSEIQSRSETQAASAMENRLSRPFAEMPDLSTTLIPSESFDRRPNSKIGGWLSNIIGTASKPTRRTREDFYSCRPQHRRAVSESSSAVSELESPGLTIASQWSAGHRRTVTADSVMTPASTAPSTSRRFPDTDAEHMARSSIKWVSGNESHSEVGLAL